MTYFLKALIFLITSLVLLKLLGKRAFSEMTISESVVMISLGTLLVTPLKSHNSWLVAYGGLLLIIGSLILSYIQIYFPRTKRWISGQPIIIIKEGQIIKENLKRARMTEDDLKMHSRMQKINEIKNIKYASLEVSGYLGIELFPEHSHVTKKEFEVLKQTVDLIANKLNVLPESLSTPNVAQNNLFLQAEKAQGKDPIQ